ncbi:MAG: YigZ family protein [Planctomycetes bacterium]|nr:YigZ family protein [Planctomycetota bacterium]
MSSRYQTIAASTRFEIEKVKASRFLADALPLGDEREVESALKRVRKEFHDARHHCWAYRLGPGGLRFRSSDDGEPGGSAGKPILQQIEARALSDVLVVVTRWFGGTKLGVGGLVRAYGAAAAAVLDRSPRRAVVLTQRIEIAFPYERTAVVQGLLSAGELAPAAAHYDVEVRLEVEMPLDQLDAFEHELCERSASRARFRRLAP